MEIRDTLVTLELLEVKEILDFREVQGLLVQVVLQDYLEALDQLDLLEPVVVLEQLVQLALMENVEKKGQLVKLGYVDQMDETGLQELLVHLAAWVALEIQD